MNELVDEERKVGQSSRPRPESAPSDQPMVLFEEVQKSYDGETLVVKNLNLRLERGEFMTMLGPSGSGKTTCLMMVAGFEPATHGEIYLDGQPINSVPPHKRGIGMVFQNYALFPHLTIAENLAFPLEVRGFDKAERERKVQRALDMVQMGEGGFHGRRPAQLSGGQQQRVALARALVFEPELVLMDEPLGALDKQLREHMQFEIKHLHESLGVSVIYVTHDQSEALTMSDRVAVFNDGVIQQLASPEELYEKPENSFVAQFIGENNTLVGKIRSINDGIARVLLNDGEEVMALAINAGPGERTQLSIRPERVEIDPDESVTDHTVTGRVEEVIYLGDHIRTRMTVADNSAFVVKTRNRLGARRFKAGESVRVGWATEDCRALDHGD